MGENEWLNGYLEAILDVGTGRNARTEAESSDESERSKKKNLNNSIRKKLDDEMLKFEKMGIQKQKEDHTLFSPTKYFVEEVVNSFDEADLHRAWIKVQYTYLAWLTSYRKILLL